MVSPKRPHGPRLLLPAEIELCKAIGASEEEYWFFTDQTASYNGKRSEAYDLIPDIKAGFVPPLIAGGSLTWLGQIAVGVALSTISYLLTPKPKQPKQGTSQRTADAVGSKKFAPQFSFNSIQELALLGETVPLIFANRIDDRFGGVRVNSLLIWSQMLSLGKLQQLKAMALFSLGTIEREPDYAGFAIGDMLLNSYTSHKVALYFRENGGRITKADRYHQSKLVATLETDPFTVNYPSDNGYPTHKAFSGVRNPTTQSIFGAYAPMPNATIFKLPYELVRHPKGSGNEAARDMLRKRKKVELAMWPTRCGIQSSTNGGNVGSIIKYIILGAVPYGNQPEDNNEETGYAPHGVEDVRNAVNSIRETTDNHLAIGETYLIGTAVAKCTSITSTKPWEIGISKEYTFEVTEKGDIDVVGNLTVHCDNPKWNPAAYWDINGRKIYNEQIWNGRQLYASYSVYVPQRLAIGTITNNRKCDVTEIGLKSKVYKQMTFANVNSQPSEAALARAWEDRSQIQLGQLNRFIKRFSFFKLQVRRAGEDGAWDDLTNSDTTNHLGLFCVKGSSPESQYNYITIRHQYTEQYEYRFLPYPGNYITRNSFGIGKFVNLLGASTNASAQGIGDFECQTTYGKFDIRFAGQVNYPLSVENINNKEWKLGDPNETFSSGKVDDFYNSNGHFMSNNGAFTIPSSTHWVEIEPYYALNVYTGDDSWRIFYYRDKKDWLGNITGGIWSIWWDGQNVATDDSFPAGNYHKDAVEIESNFEGTPRRYKPVLNNFGGHPPSEGYAFGNPNFFYIKIEERQTVASPKIWDQLENVSYTSGTSGGGSGLKVRLEIWENSSTGLVAAKWTIDPQHKGTGYVDGELVDIPARGVFPGVTGLQIKVALETESLLDENLNQYDVVSDWNDYEGDKGSHQDGPEHEIVYVNEELDMGSSPIQYSEIAFAGIRLNSSKEWTNFTQLSAYFKKGIEVKRLIDGGTGATNLFPEIAYALLTDAKLGAGKLIGVTFVDEAGMETAAQFCRANDYYWDGVISERVNLREFIYSQAGYCLLDFQIIGGKFSLKPSVPYKDNDFTINHFTGPDIKAMFTDGNIKDLKVSYLSPEERQTFIANVIYRKEVENGFPETQSLQVSLKDSPADDPLESFDLSGFCTSRKQALDFAQYALKTRKLVDHGITFRTAPQYVLNLVPGDYFRLVSEVTHTNRFRNGAKLDDGTIVSKDNMTGSESVYYWQQGTEKVEIATLSRVPNGSLFTVQNTTTENKIYKLETLSYGEDGLIDISASYTPIEPSTGYFSVLQGWGTITSEGPDFNYSTTYKT